MNKHKRYPLGSVLVKLLKNVNQKDKRLYLFFILYTITASLFPFFGVVLPKFILQELTKDQASSNRIFTIVGLYLLVASVVGFLQTYIEHYVYPRLTYLRIRYVAKVFHKVISADYPYMEDSDFMSDTSRAFQAVGGDQLGIEEIYRQLFLAPAEFFTAFGFILLIGYLNVWIILGILLHLLVTLVINARIHRYEYRKRKDISKTNHKIDYYYRTTHDFGYGKDLRIYGLRERLLQNYHQQIQTLTAIHRGIKRKAYAFSFLSLLTLLLSDGLIYGLLIQETLNGLSIANFSMYLAAIISLSSLLLSFTHRISRIYSQGQYVHEYFTFIERYLGEEGGPLETVADETLAIEFRNVSFKYPKTDRYVIKNLNLTIKKGEKLAIVGVNGAGKTTLVKLMLGLYPVTEGQILINGIPIERFDKRALFRMFSVVFQDIQLFALTVKENIAGTSNDINERRVIEVLERVGLYEKIKKLPKGIDTMMLKVIDEQGLMLSGGEIQKFAIARALYKNGKMVIMDEPTAALDALAEAEIYQQMDALVDNKTAVYISHRLASTKFCDTIAFFDHEGLKEYGSHDELMAKKGAYYEMFMIQGKYYQEGGSSRA